MRTKLFALALLVFAVPAFAQQPVSKFVSADDLSVAMMVGYYGSGTSATMEVAQGGAITFQVGAAAYTGFECPVSGALGGIIDTTNGACDTIDEVVDTINGNCTGCSSDFRAVAVDSLGTDNVDDFLTVAATQVTRSDGFSILFDTTANFVVGETRALIPDSCRTNISCFVTPRGKILENPFAGQQTVVTWIEGKNTYASGTSTLKVYSVKPSNKTNTTESITTLWSEVMGATTVNKQFTQFQYVPILGGYGEKVVVRVTNSAAQSAITLLVSANQRPIP